MSNLGQPNPGPEIKGDNLSLHPYFDLVQRSARMFYKFLTNLKKNAGAPLYLMKIGKKYDLSGRHPFPITGILGDYPNKKNFTFFEESSPFQSVHPKIVVFFIKFGLITELVS